ncbi:MAG: metal-dependent hydrolase [Ruminococcaceae bacterium]|nr:metal-dependent hydrolase [Oscillospiraceae bacterium]
MIIDFHTHTFPDRIAARAIEKLEGFGDINSCADGTASGLLKSMDGAGIDISVVLPVATAERQVVSINDGAIRARESFSGKGIFSFGAMHPDFADWHAELSRLAQNGIPGFKLHPDYQGVYFNDPRIKNIIYRANELGLTVVTHAGVDIGIEPPVRATPERVLEVVNEVRPEKLVLAHMGGWQMWDEVADKLFDTNVKVDTSFVLAPHYHRDGREVFMLAQDKFVSLVKAFGAERVLFGTDSPWADQSLYVSRLESLGFDEDMLSRIMYKNAADILGIQI